MKYDIVTFKGKDYYLIPTEVFSKEVGLVGYLTRQKYTEEETLGELIIKDNGEEIFRCKTLELPYLDNKRNISCIIEGEYDTVPYNSEKYPGTYELLEVPDRTAILIHWGNYYTNTEGCILVGKAFSYINSDDVIDITSSRDTLTELKEATNYRAFKLIIT